VIGRLIFFLLQGNETSVTGARAANRRIGNRAVLAVLTFTRLASTRPTAYGYALETVLRSDEKDPRDRCTR